ncbi:TIGR02680 family protein [Salinifilum aidingensis]
MSPDPVSIAHERPDAGAPAAGDLRADRWRLHRGGIVNIWQYAETTFDLSGGRGVFQGTNGSGKSRTLELLLPLCLDGDLRQLGSKGFDTVSVRRLMLDEYPGGPNRVGYAWVELRRVTETGAEEFLTCGVGVKASKTSQAVSDSWRFITPLRVGSDLQLVTADRVPLSAAQLREVIGADCVLDEQAFRARVAAAVYGMPAARYGDLLHLQRTLRNPDVGLKVLEGQLENILSDALPPLDPALVERLATSFDDLESIRENILGLTESDRALRAFLTTYSSYALGVLQDRAQGVRDTREKLRRLRGEIAELERTCAEQRRERTAAEGTVAELEQRDGELESSIDALQAHPAYRELQGVRDRERLVGSARAAAITALDTASKHRAQENRSAESVVGMLRRLATDAEAAGERAEHAAHCLRAAGLGGELVPRPPAVAAAEAETERVTARTAVEAEGELLEVDRLHPPRPDADALATSFRTVTGGTQQAAEAARERAALALSLHERARRLDGERDGVVELQRRARQAQLTATDAVGRRNQVEQDLATAAAVWVEQVRKWIAEWPDGGAEDAPEPPAVDDVLGDRAVARQARDRAREWSRPRVNRQRQHVSGLEQHIAELYVQARTWEDELADLRSGSERAPERPRWATAERDPRAGRAFYELVEFRADLDAAARAGLEGALTGSGLLTAWVTADGALHGGPDLVATERGERSWTGLDTALAPVSGGDGPVPAERVAELLARVGVASSAGDAAAGLVLGTDGSWRAGVLSGACPKGAAEFVGAGARQDARTRRIAQLEEDLARLREDIGAAERQHREVSEHVTRLEQHVESFPDDDELLTAHAKLDGAREAVESTGTAATDLRQEHEQAERRWQAEHAELVQEASQADLPSETGALEQAHRAATEAVSVIESLRTTVDSRCLHTASELHDLLLRHDAAVADRMEAETQAEQRCAEHAEQESGLAELTTALADETQDIGGKLAELEAERGELRRRLPEQREKVSALRESAARWETELQHKHSQLEGREAAAEEALESLRAALRTPGLWTAAFTPQDEAGTAEPQAAPEPEQAVEALLAASRRSASEATVLNRVQALQQSLSGGYDIAAGERGGVLTVTITGDEGPQPVAEAALRIAERLAEQRGYLNERYQSIFADYLIRDLADRLRGQISTAERLCHRMNEVLEGARSSQGVHVQLDWRPSTALDDDLRRAIDAVRTPAAERGQDEDALLRRVFTKLIESERDSAAGGYAEVLGRALDYRSWFTFTVRVRDTAPDGSARVRRLRQLSSGETRLISYVTLFAAAAAFYDAVSVSAADLRPLRLVLLDEAFERLDEPTVARMLELLVDLDMDWLITWPSGWGVSPKIPRMHIYDVLRPRSGHGIACTHTTWDGRAIERSEW